MKSNDPAAGNGRDITWHASSVAKGDYRARNGHGSLILWFTGLSASGKSTISTGVHEALFRRGWHTYVLDGDNIRHGLNSDLGFSDADRRENIRRIGEVAKLMVDAGVVVLAAFISPFREDRDRVRRLVEEGEFVEVYVKCDIDTCESRDPKGLYAKARRGEIPHFTGISSPYEEPLDPEIVLDTARLDREQAVQEVLDYLDRMMVDGRQADVGEAARKAGR
ncbi:MAG TPA: adenylyl-sulfate kinase [Verrucomicrobiae bacterium]|nr:adenylyl-sulfate kinase [Verrucomicrobiae bacterium]